MKAKLIFDLEEPQDIEDYKRCNLSLNMAMAINEYDRWLREQYKYGGDEEAHRFRDKFREVMSENDIDINTLVQ